MWRRGRRAICTAAANHLASKPSNSQRISCSQVVQESGLLLGRGLWNSSTMPLTRRPVRYIQHSHHGPVCGDVRQEDVSLAPVPASAGSARHQCRHLYRRASIELGIGDARVL